jgi:hypothetical protein
MTRVISCQGMFPVLLLTVHGHIRPIGGSRAPWLGVPVAYRLPRGLRVSLGQGGSKLGGRALLMMPQGLGRDGEISPETPIMPEAFLQGSGEIEFTIRG